MAKPSSQQIAAQQAAAQAAAQQAAEEAAKKAQKRADLLTKQEVADAASKENEKYYEASLSAIYQLETAAAGLEFMNEKQKTNVQGKVQNGISPSSALIDKLGLDDNGACLNTIKQALDLLSAKKTKYRDDSEYYANEANRYYSEYLSV